MVTNQGTMVTLQVVGNVPVSRWGVSLEYTKHRMQGLPLLPTAPQGKDRGAAWGSTEIQAALRSAGLTETGPVV